MTWSRVIGQERTKHALLSALRAGRLSHAYLLYGPEGVGKDAMALELARVLHCERGGEEPCGECPSCMRLDLLQHPDVMFVTALPVGKGEKSDDPPLAKLTDEEVRNVQEQLRLKAQNPYSRIAIARANVIKINSIREIRRESSLSTSDGRARVIIISRAEEMGDDAANTLLKTLEEPPGRTMIILTTSQRDSLLPTIQSRCQAIRFDLLKEEDIRTALMERNGLDAAQAGIVARLANGSYGRALELMQEDVARQRDEVVDFLREVLGSSRLLLVQHIERLSAGRDRDGVTRFLTLLLMWLRDAMVFAQGGGIINLDQQDPIRRFVAKYPGANLLEALADVERAISLVQGNVYIMAVLLQLSTQLKSAIAKR